MLSPRLRKLLRDLWAERGRALLMVTAIAVSLVAVGTVLGAYAILTREIAVNYLGTRPASATLDLPGGVDRSLLEEVRRRPEIAEAEARDVVLARARAGDDWRPLLLFVIDDFADLRLGTFRSESGAWPPPEGTMLIERTAASMLEAAEGQEVLVKTPAGPPRAIKITGTVHDPGLAPAWQERRGYGYVTRATIAGLGEAPVLHELRISVRENAQDGPAIEATAEDVARWLQGRGVQVHQIRVPPPGRHPHQLQMVTILVMMLAFSVMALLLSAILVATSLSAMLARQTREIGVMKTIGARSSQIAALYFAMIASVGAVSFLVAWPLGIHGARSFAGATATMLNFTLTSVALPAWVIAIQAVAGLVVPLAVAAGVIGRAARITAREAIQQHGVSAGALRPWLSSLPPAIRNALRRPARLALTLGLLSAGGAMFMTALDISRGWERNIAKIYETRSYDVEIRLHAAEPTALADTLRALPGVRVVEPWGYSEAALARPGQIDLVRTYPDRGHGSFAVLAPPPGTELIRFPLRAGRWLLPDDTGAVVLNHSAAAQAPAAKVGSEIAISMDGVPTTWRVVGIVEEIGSPATAYATDASFARIAGTQGKARVLRIATGARSPEQRTAILRDVERALLDSGVGVESAIPLAELRTAVGDHIVILVRALMAMAVVMAIVGVLSLVSTMGVNVLERTSEIGVMKAIGATSGRILRLLLAEALFIAAASTVLAFGLSIPLTLLVDTVVGNLGFLAPLPLEIAPSAVLSWIAAVLFVTPLVTLLPARRAARLTVREALAQV